jgi:hypothetical protein
MTWGGDIPPSMISLSGPQAVIAEAAGRSSGQDILCSA